MAAGLHIPFGEASTERRPLFLPGADGSCRIEIGGTSKLLVKQHEMFDTKGETVYYWAENGLIKWEHLGVKGTNRRKTGLMTWQDAAERVRGLSEMILNSREAGHFADEKIRMQRFICDMETLLREAKDQGGPVERGVIDLVPQPRKQKMTPIYDESDF